MTAVTPVDGYSRGLPKALKNRPLSVKVDKNSSFPPSHIEANGMKYRLAKKIPVKITHYNPTGPGLMQGKDKTAGRGITSTGRNAGRMDGAAADPKSIPYGSIVYVNGEWRVIDDTGGALRENHVDVRISGYREALEKGVQRKTILVYYLVD